MEAGRLDAVTLSGIRAYGRIGTLAHERESRQLVTIDLTADIDLRLKPDAVGRLLSADAWTTRALAQSARSHRLDDVVAVRSSNVSPAIFSMRSSTTAASRVLA